MDDVDIVLFATGYDFSFPFLDNVSITRRRIKGLYQHVFNADDPTLSFIGMVSPTAGSFVVPRLPLP